jgi:hypothetical protein
MFMHTNSVDCCEKPDISLHEMIHGYHKNDSLDHKNLDCLVLNFCIILS